MKNPHLEKLRTMQLQYHRSHNWDLSENGLFIRHSYANKDPDDLSYWDDVGFIQGKKRIIVWWQHPRHLYSDEIDTLAFAQAGEFPDDNWMGGGEKNYVKVGASRKKVISIVSRRPSVSTRSYYDRCSEIRKRLTAEGIDFNVTASWKQQRLTWSMGVSLVAPLEVRNEKDLQGVADLARRLILQKTTLEAEFPGYSYGRADWLLDMEKIKNQESQQISQ